MSYIKLDEVSHDLGSSESTNKKFSLKEKLTKLKNIIKEKYDEIKEEIMGTFKKIYTKKSPSETSVEVIGHTEEKEVQEVISSSEIEQEVSVEPKIKLEEYQIIPLDDSPKEEMIEEPVITNEESIQEIKEDKVDVTQTDNSEDINN
jgi:hypothetical protein